MQWEKIKDSLSPFQTKFEQSYKCLNQNRQIKQDTVDKHLQVLIENYNSIRATLHRNYDRYTTQHKEEASEIFHTFRDKLLKIFHKHNINTKVPLTLGCEVVREIVETEDIKYELFKMTDQSKFIDLTSKILPEFSGKHEDLQKFVDALSLIDSMKGEHEGLAIQVIHTKISGPSRATINGLNTIQGIINKLKSSIKGESAEMLVSKLMATKQKDKNKTVFAREIEDLSRSLMSAYISEGLPQETANKYTVQNTVKAMIKNVNSDRTKLIIEAGTFDSVEQVVTKFLSSQSGLDVSNVLHCHSANNNDRSWERYGNNRYTRSDRYGNRGRGGRQFNNRNNNGSSYRNNFSYNDNRNNNNRGPYLSNNRGNNLGGRSNIRAIEVSENSEIPQ